VAKIKDQSDVIVEREYTRMAGQLEEAMQCYDGAARPQLLTQVRELRTSVKKGGLKNSDIALGKVKCVLQLIEIEKDLRRNAPKSWTQEEKDAHIRELMSSL
jgi:hypothetical protein